MPRGKKTGGRSKGVPNKRKTVFRTALRAYCDSINVDPHHYMADILADETTIIYGLDKDGHAIEGPAAKPELKLNAAKELAQYLEPKLKAIEHTGNAEKPIVVSIRRAH